MLSHNYINQQKGKAMTIKDNFKSFESLDKTLKLLDVSLEEMQQAINKGYRRYKTFKNGKFRWIEEPNDELKIIQQKLLLYLQNNLECPTYCTAGFKGQNNIKNAEKHRNKREVLTMDISHYFPNTQEKYVRKIFSEFIGVDDNVLNLLVKITTFNGYLPTGAATSTILSCFVHKEIFDNIFKKMKSLDIDMTVYVDDITLSTHKHISNWVISHINNSLQSHGLFLKKSKIKRYGYKHAVVTGVHIAQSGKMSAPFKIGHSAICALCDKDLKQMSLTELRKIIVKISYIQQFNPLKMIKVKKQAIKQLKKLQKISANKNERI